MKIPGLIILLILPLQSLFAQVPDLENKAARNLPKTAYVPGVISVQLSFSPSSFDLSSPEFTVLKDALQKYNLQSIAPAFASLPELSSFVRITFDPTKVTAEQIINELQGQPGIQSALKIPVPVGFQLPGDYNGNLMWYINQIKIEKSWGFKPTNHKIKIAIVDNGVRMQHEDIEPNLWTNPGEIANNKIDDDGNGYVDDIHGWDVSDNDNDPNPPLHKCTDNYFTHGTHVAGLASASTDNSRGIVSVGYNTEIIVVKVVPSSSVQDNYYYDAYKGLEYAIAAGADVINVSWGATAMIPEQRAILDRAISQGIIIVASAGNDGGSNPIYPAAYGPVIAVGATNNEDVKADFSNYGTWVDVMAPGVNIYSCKAGSNTSYGTWSGTSQAAPIVSGLVGLMISQQPDRVDSIAYYLRGGCDNIDPNNDKNLEGKLGAGRINVDWTIDILNKGQIPSGIIPPVATIKATIFPNPANTFVNIRTEEELQKVELFDLQGRLILQDLPVDGRLALDVLDHSGIYLIKIYTASGFALERLSITR